MDANGSGKDGFTEGSPSPLVAATVVTDDWLNDAQENLAQAIEVELALSKGSFTQLRDMLYAREDKRTLANFREIIPPTSGAVMLGAYDSGSLWVAVGAGGKIQYSANGGINWTETSAGGGYTDSFHNVTKMGSTWCAVGDVGGIQTSTNGTAWTSRTPAAAYAGNFRSVATNGTIFVAVGSAGEIQTSSDGVTWTHRASAAAYANTFHSVAYDPISTGWIAVGQGGVVQNSADGLTWGSVDGVGSLSISAQVCALPSGGFLVVKHDGSANVYVRKSTAAAYAVFTSAVTLATTSTTTVNALAIGCDDRRAVMVLGGSIRHARVADLATWTSEDIISADTVYGLHYARKSFLAVGAFGSNTWLARTLRHA